jgi:hypothetical protein
MSSSYKVKKYIAKLSKEKSPKKINAYCKKIMKYNKNQNGGAGHPWEDVGNPKLAQLEAIKGITDKLQAFADENKGKVEEYGKNVELYKKKVVELGTDFAKALEYLKKILDAIPDKAIDDDVLKGLVDAISKLELDPNDIAQGDELWNAVTLGSAPPVPTAQPAP